MELWENTPNQKVIQCPIPTHLPVDNDGEFLFVSTRQRDVTHAIHKYPAKFIPDLPNWFIRRYTTPGQLVLDPFMGSGTTNLEASLLDRPSIGVDIDAFSRFIARVKTTPIANKELDKPYHILVKRINQYSPSTTTFPEPDFPHKDHWFKEHVRQELAFIKSVIGALQCSDQVRDLFLLSMSAIVKQVSEANHNCLRTCIRRNQRKNVQQGEALARFLKQLDFNVNAVRRLDLFDTLGSVEIPEKLDAKNLQEIGNDTVDLAVTSPPYLNAIDYPRTHQLEIYWLGFASGSLTPLKKKNIGTETVKASFYNSFVKTNCPRADSIIEKIFQFDKRRAGIASLYLLDMFKNLSEVYRVLKPKSRYIIIIWNNSVRGHLFETWNYLCWYAKNIGFQLEYQFRSGIINHFMKIPRDAQMHQDYVLILQKD